MIFWIFLYFTATIIIKSLSKGYHCCLSRATSPTSGEVLHPVQVALQDGDPNTNWRPFGEGDDLVRLTLNIVMPSDNTSVYLILTVSDLPCQQGLDIYSHVTDLIENITWLGEGAVFRECPFEDQRNDGQRCRFLCPGGRNQQYLTVTMQFQRFRWIQYDPSITDISTEFV